MGRILFDPNSLSPEGDEVSPAAFLLRDLKEPEDYLSVFRTAFMELTRQFAENLIKKVPEDNTICGYAHLSVQDIHDYAADETLMVALPRPSRSLPHHSGIYVIHNGHKFAGSGDCNHPAYTKAAEYLAKMSDLKYF